MNCDEVRSRIPLLLYGELSFDQEAALEAHLEGCPECRGEVSLQMMMQRALDRVELTPPAALLSRCRRDLAARVRSAPPTDHRPSLARAWLGWLSEHSRIPQRVWQPAAALLLLAIGFVSSRMLAPAGSGTSGARPVASRVRYVEPEGSDRVQLVVEETRQRVLNGRPGDEPIRRLLLAAASDPSDPGVRVESIDVLRNETNTREVRRALLNALLHDPNAGVRLKALEGLKPYANEPETRHTLARVLLNDDSPGVRTQAIDLLMRQRESDVVDVLQQLLRKEDNGYIRMRSRRALRDMRASEGTF